MASKKLLLTKPEYPWSQTSEPVAKNVPRERVLLLDDDEYCKRKKIWHLPHGGMRSPMYFVLGETMEAGFCSTNNFLTALNAATALAKRLVLPLEVFVEGRLLLQTDIDGDLPCT